MPTKKDLLRKIAALESMNDQLVTELAYVDRLMREIGFSNGLESVKETASELLEDQQPKHISEDGQNMSDTF